MKKLTGVLALFAILLFSGFSAPKTLQGTWIFGGGIYNGKKEGAPTDYRLEKRYTATDFASYLVEKGAKPEKYQSGIYALNGSTYTETETFSAQPSQLTGQAIHYKCTLSHDTLTIQGTLPTGMKVEEYWKKSK